MTTIKELKSFVNSQKVSNEIRLQLEDYVQLAEDEVEQGSSEEHEVDLALNDINTILSNLDK